MGEEELRQLQEAALRALKAGKKTPSEINAIIAEQTGGQYTSYGALVERVSAPTLEYAAETTPIGRALESVGVGRMANPEAVSDFLRAAGQGATLGFADELVGLFGGDTQVSRERIARLRDVDKTATLLSEFAGAAALPVGILGQAVKGRVFVPAATGAVSGGLLGAGEAEGTPIERLPSTLLGLSIGGASGTLLGGIGAGIPALGRIIRLKLQPGRAGQELSNRLMQRVGQGTETLTSLMQKSQGRIEEVRRALFQPLEREFRSVDDPLIRRVMGKLLDDERTSAVVKRVVPGKVRAWVTGKPGRAPSFTELQKIRRALGNEITRSKPTKTYPGDPNRMEVFSQANDLFTGAVDRRIPAFAEARTQYGRVIAADKAIEQAYKLRNAPVDVIEDALRKLPTDEARENFRARLVLNLYDKLSRKGDVSRQEIDKLVAIGERQRIRQLFTSQNGFDAFMADLQAGRRAAVAKEALVPITMRIMEGLGFAGGGYVGYRIARGLID